ncbi:Flp family type IVb pilin [Parerythrobacter aurantius]|uniref:Flp family type IVb pilin n=1 Tax=Parerythrobacter aurantius TaxID=3127706 RepID=UPI003245F871
MQFVKSFMQDESGASAAEYALILVVVGLAIVAAAQGLSGAIAGAMDRTSTKLNSVT